MSNATVDAATQNGITKVIELVRGMRRLRNQDEIFANESELFVQKRKIHVPEMPSMMQMAVGRCDCSMVPHTFQSAGVDSGG